MITQVKWNTEMPKFEDVENKITLVWWEDSQNIVHTDVLNNWSRDAFENNFKGMVKFTILSDEPVYCEWVNRGTYWQGCGGQWSLVYKFCPHCGLPIKVIDELKPLPLMGIEPVINVTFGIYQCVWENNGDTIISLADTKKVHAIESWNLLVKKLTGEK